MRKFCESSDGNIHTDHKSKVITVLVYFNTDWDEQAGQLRLLRSRTDIEDYAAEVPPAGGTLLAFRRTRNSWHGHKRFVGMDIRRPLAPFHTLHSWPHRPWGET